MQGLPSEPKHYNGKLLCVISALSGLRQRQYQWLPGFINLSADITLKDGVGTTVLTTKDASVALPGLFPAAAFHFDSIGGTVVWNTVNGISLEFKDVLIENADAAVKVNGSYTTPTTLPSELQTLKPMFYAETSLPFGNTCRLLSATTQSPGCGTAF